MIDLHYAPTPNGWKISIMLEELGLPCKVIPVEPFDEEARRNMFGQAAKALRA
jgi:glutathione S-transferase